MVIPIKKRKTEHYHIHIMHIQISLGSKFQNEITILIFWIKLTQKGYSHSKTGKLNTSTDFCIFKLVLVPNFRLN